MRDRAWPIEWHDLPVLPAVSAPSYVQQRGTPDFDTMAGVGDCMIASLATVTGVSYERMAAALSFACDPETGLPQGTERGLTILDISVPLLDLGFAATLVVAPGAREFVQNDEVEAASIRRLEAKGVPFRFTDPSTIKRVIRGRRAVLLIGNVATPTTSASRNPRKSQAR